MSAKAIFTILILTLSLSVEGQNYKNIQKEWDSIKSDRTTYICGEGYGETLEEADQNALSDLISKISVQVTSEFDITESENYANGKLDASSTVLSKVSTYSNATLTNTERLTLSNEPEARVGRYIRRTELEKIFESRIVKVKEYAYYGEKAVKARKIDDALRYFNWSLLLLQSVPHSSEIAFQSDNGRNVILSTWLPVQIDDVLDNIHCEFVKSDGFNAVLNFSYEGAPITSIDYSCFDGRNWSNIYSAKDGIGVVELPSDVEISNVQLRFECSFKGQSHIDKDVEAVFKTQKLKALKNAYINIPVKVSSYQDSKSDNKSIKRELGDPTAHTETIYADNIGKTNGKLSFLDTTEPYSTIINNICSAIKTKNYSSVKASVSRAQTACNLMLCAGTDSTRMPCMQTACARMDSTQTQRTYKILVRSNLIYDAALVPNIGLELPIYRGLTFSGDWNYAWWFSYPKNIFYQTYGGYAGFRYHFGREAARNQLTGHFAGVSAIALTYDFELGKRGYQYDDWNFGVQAEYGYTQPLKNGKWAFTFSLGVGYVRLNYKEYLPMDTHYVYQRSVTRDWFGPTRLEVSICRIIEFKSEREKKGGGQR